MEKWKILQQNYVLLGLLLLWMCWQGTMMNLLCSGWREAKEAFETSPEAAVQKSKKAFIKQNTYMEKHKLEVRYRISKYMKRCREGRKEQFVPPPAFCCCLWEAQWQWPSWRHSSRDCGNYPMALCCKDNVTNSLNLWLNVQPQPLAHCSWGQKWRGFNTI